MKLGIFSFCGTAGELADVTRTIRMMMNRGVHPVAVENASVFLVNEKSSTAGNSRASDD